MSFFFLHFRLCLFCFVYTVIFFFFKWMVILLYSALCEKFWACGFYRFWVWFYMLWFLLYRLKECGFENLNNPLFGKPKIHRNRWFSSHFDRFRLAIPIQTDRNRTEHTPTLYPATSDYRKFWNYTWNSAISREMTQPMLLLALQA